MSYRITDVECIGRAKTTQLNLTGEMKKYIKKKYIYIWDYGGHQLRLKCAQVRHHSPAGTFARVPGRCLRWSPTPPGPRWPPAKLEVLHLFRWYTHTLGESPRHLVLRSWILLTNEQLIPGIPVPNPVWSVIAMPRDVQDGSLPVGITYWVGLPNVPCSSTPETSPNNTKDRSKTCSR